MSSRSSVVIKKEKGDDSSGSTSSNEDDDEVDNNTKTNKRKRKDSVQKGQSTSSSFRNMSGREHFLEVTRGTDGYKNNYFALNSFERHQKLVNNYLLYHPRTAGDVLKRDTSKDKNDTDIIREYHRFVWREEDEGGEHSWEKDLAKKYYDKLFKEYGVCDLSRYKDNKIAIRWRVQQEVIDGKGQFSCGEKKCTEAQDMKSWEVNFAYLEDRTKKNALVKLRLCPTCSLKLNFSYKRKEVTKKPKKRKRHRSSSRSGSKRRHDRETAEGGTSSVIPEKSIDAASENIWKAPVVIPELKSRDEEFDEYLEDLFL